MRSATLAVSCCLWGGVVASERFPLSGIVSNGVNVQVKGKLIEQDARIDFETPDRQVVFSFQPDLEDERVVRESPIDGSALNTFGGLYPFSADGTFTIDFLKTKSMWKVTVNGERLPWFDHPIDPARQMTHVRIYDGVQNPRVKLTRPECSTVCSADECDSCPASECFTVSPGTCKSETMTDDAGDDFHCCEGAEDGLESTGVGSWVQTHADPSVVQSACKAFGEACTDDNLNGKVAQVKTFDPVTKIVDLYVPSLTGGDEETTFRVTSYVLKNHDRITTLAGDVARADITVDYSTYLITEGAAGLKGKYVLLIGHSDDNKWRALTKWRHEQKSTWKMVLTTIPFGNPKDFFGNCAPINRDNGNQWLAPRNNPLSTLARRTCALFGNGAPGGHGPMCSVAGEELPGFKEFYGDGQSFETKRDRLADNTRPDQACCECGGGDYGSDLSVIPTGSTVVV